MKAGAVAAIPGEARDWFDVVGGARVPGRVDPDLAAAREALRRFAAKRPRPAGDSAGLAADLDAVVEICQRSEVLAGAQAARVERVGAQSRLSGLDVASHLRREHRIPGGRAKALVSRGKALEPFPVIAGAAARGDMAPAQAEECARQLADFPVEDLGQAALDNLQRALVSKAARLGVKAIRAEARRAVDQARAEAGLGGGADRLERQRAAAQRERFLSFTSHGQTMRISGLCPVDVGLKIKQRLAGAAQAIRRASTDPRPLGSAAGELRLASPEGGGERESFGASMLDALAALAEIEPPAAAPLAAGKPARFVVHVRAEDLGLFDAPGMAQETGEPLAPSAVRAAFCDSELVRVVLGADSEVLDVGTTTRRVPKGLRIALEARDLGCCFPGCDQPPSACQAHHLWKWECGCPTSLETLALLCPTHHRIAEPAWKLPDGTRWRPGMDDPSRWRIEIDPEHRHPVAIPPARVDPLRRPMLNDRIAAKLKEDSS
jgi:hypothetical protein